MIEKGKKYSYAINILSLSDRFQTMKTIFDQFEKLHIKMLAKAEPNRDTISSPSMCL